MDMTRLEAAMIELEAALAADPDAEQTAPAVPEGQIAREALRDMSYTDIDQARRDGRLNHVMGLDK